MLLLDWSRMNPKPGGLSRILIPIIENVLVGNMKEARRLAFTQQLLSGMPDMGGWGGAAKSDVEVRVIARNKECCRVLKEVLSKVEVDKDLAMIEIDGTAREDSTPMDSGRVSKIDDAGALVEEEREEGNSGKPFRVAVLYGAYHISDLTQRFEAMGLEFQPRQDIPQKKQTVDQRTPSLWTWLRDIAGDMDSVRSRPYASSTPSSKWSPRVGTDDSLPAGLVVWTMSRPRGLLGGRSRDQDAVVRLVLVGIALPMYLSLGAVDWWLLLHELSSGVTALQHILPAPQTLSYTWPALGTGSWPLSSGVSVPHIAEDDVPTLLAAVVFVVTYVQRHMAAHQWLSQTAVDWNSSLFAEAEAENGVE